MDLYVNNRGGGPFPGEGVPIPGREPCNRSGVSPLQVAMSFDRILKGAGHGRPSSVRETVATTCDGLPVDDAGPHECRPRHADHALPSHRPRKKAAGASNGVRRGPGLIVLRRSMKSRTIGGVRWGSRHGDTGQSAKQDR